MPNQTKRFRLNPVYIAILAAVPLSISAQEAEPAKKAEANSDVEVITVTGLRGSLKKTINDKRFGQNIADSINAEDIGKTTDQNIADALGRVTGVSVQQSEGEGAKISVRGANSNQNNISMNGVQLSSTDFNQGVDLSQYSSDILSKIEVVKTPSADHEEGSLGANINLLTNKPLDLGYEIRNLTVEGRYNDLSEDENYKVSGTISKKFAEETFGVVLTAYTETNSYRRDQFVTDNWNASQSREAMSTDGELLNDVWALTPQETRYETFLNDRDRMGANLGLQWLPTDSTEMNLNLTWSKQEVDSSMHGIRTRTVPSHPNHVEGVDPGLGQGPATETDPERDWHTIDTNTNTYVKNLNRYGDGSFLQSENAYDNENLIVAYDIEQQFGDNLTMNAGIGYSKSERTPDNSVYIVLESYQTFSNWQMVHTPSGEVEPVGYDCTSSKNCKLVGGDGFIDYGANTDPNDPLAKDDNRSTTKFNPHEIEAQHLSYMSRTLTAVEDTNKSVNVDFDYAVEFGPITMIEFGAKYSNREKYVDDQTGQFTTVGEGVVLYDPETGEVRNLPFGIQSIDASLFRNDDEDFPADDFMKKLDYERDNFTTGLPTFSAFAAMDAALGGTEAEFSPSDTNTRRSELDNIATYLKASFELLDGSLTGDIGVRYVKTDVESFGANGVKFAFDGSNNGRLFDPFHIAAVGDATAGNPNCAAVPFQGTDYNQAVRWARTDGNGYETKGTADYRDDTPIPAADGVCYDWYADPTQQASLSDWWLWRHSDISTEKNYVYGDRQISEDGTMLLATEDRQDRSQKTSAEHDYDMWLPSLNLNYIIDDTKIARFAASKTMSRPEIDALRPGFTVVETQWGFDNRNNTMQFFNTKLDPLESNNLDLSLEWYFDDSAMVAAGFFYKDMSNFQESQTIITYMDDLRNEMLADSPQYNNDDLVLLPGDDPQTNLQGCMPKRIQNATELNEDWVQNGQLDEMCAKFKTTSLVNGKGASIAGVELSYLQTYDFLPGWMSGLGLQANYTYQDSEYDQEVSSVDDSVKLPALEVAYTPEHSYNVSAFWEQNGHQLRLSYQGTSDQLAQRSYKLGSLWEEGRDQLDFSGTYKYNDYVSFTVQATNLLDENFRQYYTSRFTDLGGEVLDEGSALSGNATDSRTHQEYAVGRNYRASVRVNF
ncbi:TonB-dependent receptor [Echinimonas agarilytica]|uniref:TonB-dependent receptor n=1 Tax=Echinimonas agarilytica TaxID=1215918 RepID=A0AA41W9P6_9GAMM|nr:TonB-dependent receptor [Echinimonas agarilytica]MCM2681167.1 TonB-dependent receptor [Echinimonas agarilytica]